MKKKSWFLMLAMSLFFMSIVFNSCDVLEDVEDPVLDSLKYALGYGVNNNVDDNSEIEDDIALGTFYGSATLPEKADVLDYFPAIGDQGAYGTCVAWATGYNHRTFLEAKRGGYTNPSGGDKTYSAKDLFWSIPSGSKGADCGGTYFESAYDVMISRGIATMATVPYTDLGDCSGTPESAWTTNANKHKIKSYREITVDKTTLKTYLANGKAITFGAKLGEQFMECTSDAVLDYQTYGYTGQHAYHAMILCGYDDTKGANGAFRVANSWGTGWGDNGFIWVDQDYFCQTSNFCYGAYIAELEESEPDTDDDDVVDDPTSGTDLMAWQLFDVDYYDDFFPDDSADPRWRVAVYNVYNTGETDIVASEDWNIIYLLYNAYDGDDYQVVLFDYYSDDYGSPGENAGMDSYPDVSAQGYWYNYVDLPSTMSCSYVVTGKNEPFNWTYKMPDVTGDYYLIIIADGFDQFVESNEDNNFAYYTYDDGTPLRIENGIIINPPTPPTKSLVKSGKPIKNQASDFWTVRTETNANAYSAREIVKMLKVHQKSGELKRRAMEFAAKNKNQKRGEKTLYKVK